MSQRQMKEAFVSNLNGTSLLEISAGLALPPLCTVCRGLILILSQLHHATFSGRWGAHLLTDFAVLVVPLVTSCTIFSSVIFLVPPLLTILGTWLFYEIYGKRTYYARAPAQKIIDAFLKISVDSKNIPSVTMFRVYINLATAINILAVDFPLYPRRYAKTEIYGTGMMDFGVGAFVFGNAIISPEVRGKPRAKQSRCYYLAKQLFSVWPLVVLGLGRLISVKSLDYHEHLSEYGVHWNFFFTLAVVKVVASLLLILFPLNKSWIVAVIIAILYQISLDFAQLKMIILHGFDHKGTRIGFLNANREGIISIFGYVAIYMAGVQTGLYVLRVKPLLRDWIKVGCHLLLTAATLLVFLYIYQAYVEAVSRKMANLAFCIWIVAYSLMFLSWLILGNVILVFTKFLIKGAIVPCSWDLIQTLHEDKKSSEPLVHQNGRALPSLCLIAAIDRNQLLFFLLTNVMTGLVNMTVDTLHSSPSWTLTVLHLYMISNCLIMYVLHIQNITVKCW
ncbi:phosphatidylinositol-glycan biosynthesis class W protein [Dromiciops gliroides]|uniref:phosphatidylinositol-glycan biosynthesis class W protein n=1 Tax=Dromiciops gliroides TaxID=33562 RepID=UPI001CC63AC1|nr:phosphatidylinositol-glycan biosynthesis class W protein [Dromiciops gliroides]XP_043857079.1 phosphatidylinositol-glycan biosynthesis class W protein [Dromiciops gliroides]XP_043857080.1 phosphatidylinositol-glycan biosynthesis class W protein [Dromiciops gliroides]XP_043857081.1 phosphatidylinositol-glycan biosynthesis class W protein [Dromiciops gliroides]